jgi:hypothetical protein
VIFYSLFGVVSDKIPGMIKTTTLYQLPGYKTLELVVISEPIFSSDNYDPTSISRSSNLVMAEERKIGTTSRRGFQSVGNNDKQRFRITEQRVQDR